MSDQSGASREEYQYCGSLLQLDLDHLLSLFALLPVKRSALT